MDTTAPQDSTPATSATDLLARLSEVDPADAPPIADELAGMLADRHDATVAPQQLEAEFSAEVPR